MSREELNAMLEESAKIHADLLSAQQEEDELVARIGELNSLLREARSKLRSIEEESKQKRKRQRELNENYRSLKRKIETEEKQHSVSTDVLKLQARVPELIKGKKWEDAAYDWQIQGATVLAAAGRGFLGDERGMGKSLSSFIWRQLTESKRTLVLTRKQYVPNFVKQIQLWEPEIPVLDLTGMTAKQREFTLQFSSKMYDNFMMVTNFESWRRNSKVVKELTSAQFDSVILDEAHNLKNFASVTTKGFLEIAAAVEKCLIMTGTPMQNRPQELFTILHALYPNLFPNESSYLSDYCRQVYDENTSGYRWVFKQGGLENLKSKIGNFFIQRKRSDVGIKIPPPDIQRIELTLDGYNEQRAAYKYIAERNLAVLKSGEAMPLTSLLAVMTRQAQMTAWPAGIRFTDPTTGEIIPFDIQESVKLDWAEDLIKELIEEGQRVVLFSRFKEPIYELQRRLSTVAPVAVITGDINKNRVKEIQDDFDLNTAPENPRWPVLLATFDTVGEAVNLNAARHVILLDRYFKPSKDDQAIGRIDRLGNTDAATAYIPIIQGTIDNYLDALMEHKRELTEGFHDEMVSNFTDLRQKLIEHLESAL